MAIRAITVRPLALASIGAAAIVTCAPVPQASEVPQASYQVRLAANPAPGELVIKALTNQVENFQLQWPYIRLGVIDAPRAVLLSPLTFLGAIGSGASPLVVIGITGASMTGPVSDAWDGIIQTDLEQILPRFQNSVLSAIVAGFNVGEALPEGLPAYLQALNTGRNQVFAALSQPLSVYPDEQPPLPDTVPEVVTTEAFKVLNGVVFGGGEYVLLGVFQAPNDFYQTLANGGGVGEAVGASAARLGQRLGQAADTAAASVEEAVVNIHNAKNGVFPTALATEGTTDRSASTEDNSNVGRVPGGLLKNATAPLDRTTRSGPTTIVRPSFKAVVGGPLGAPSKAGAARPAVLPVGGPDRLKTTVSGIGDLAKSAVSDLGAQARKVAESLKKPEKPSAESDS